MKRVDLIKVEHGIKIGDKCPMIQPNVTEDCILYSDGEPIGFYMKQMPEQMCKIANVADVEFNSKRVPKSNMARGVSSEMMAKGIKNTLSQYSTILGSVPPKPHFQRPYSQRSSVHSSKSAQTFIKAMLMLAIESEKLIADILPSQYERQKELFKDVPDKWKFANLFTSSISNFNISAPFHRDTGNVVGAVNVIITKRKNANGGNLHVPDYNATFDSCDNSILVYPAWRNVHGVTPIVPTAEGGYRNSLIFYPLKAFVGLQ
jgi:hypothetical protein